MKSEERDGFDRIMSKLKPVEPPWDLEAKFKRRLAEVEAEKRRKPAIKRVLDTAGEMAWALRYLLLPEHRTLARVCATLLITTVAGLYAYFLYPSLQPSTPVLIAKEGIVLARAPHAGAWQKAGLQRKIGPGDVISTGDGSQADIELSGRYALRMKNNTRVRIARLTPRSGNGQAIFEVMEGKALIRVSAGFKGSEFIVRTKAGTATVLGTMFLVSVAGEGQAAGVNVLEGAVKVEGGYRTKGFLPEKSAVTVSAGQKTEVSAGAVPLAPTRMAQEDWAELEELYELGTESGVMLLISSAPDRVRELLRPCQLAVSEERPVEYIDKVFGKIKEAMAEPDRAKHLEKIKSLEKMMVENPHPAYDVQFLLFISAYYESLGNHEDAIRALGEVRAGYPKSSFASLAMAAIGVIYEEKLGDKASADKIYGEILLRYPNSPEAIWIESRPEPGKK